MQCPNALVASAECKPTSLTSCQYPLKNPAPIAEAISECKKELRESTSAEGLKQEVEDGLISGDSGSDNGGGLSCDVGTQLVDGILDELGISGIGDEEISDIGDLLLSHTLLQGFTALYAPLKLHGNLCFSSRALFRRHSRACIMPRI